MLFLELDGKLFVNFILLWYLENVPECCKDYCFVSRVIFLRLRCVICTLKRGAFLMHWCCNSVQSDFLSACAVSSFQLFDSFSTRVVFAGSELEIMILPIRA